MMSWAGNFRRRVEMDFGEEFWIEFDRRRIGRAGSHLGKAGVERVQKSRQVEPKVVRRVGLKVTVHTFMELTGSANISVPKMIEGHCGLDESLIKLS